MAKLWIAYICWLFGGIFGLHHFYLRRDKHAFVWWLSLGGLCVGWFSDLWRIPEYVREANEHPGFKKMFEAKREMHHKPQFSAVRFAGEQLIGMIFGYLFRLAIPGEMLTEDNIGYLLTTLLHILLPVFGAAVGVHLVGNIGHQKIRFKWSLLGAAMAVLFWFLSGSQCIAIPPLCSALLTYFKSEWFTDKPNRNVTTNLIKRVFVLFLCGSIYLSLCGSAFYNASVTSKEGEKVPVRIAIFNFLQSAAWKEMDGWMNTMEDLYAFCSYNGWGHCYELLLEQLDPTGESRAYRVLGFDTGRIPTNEIIESRCQRLYRQWNPYIIKDVHMAAKMEACEKFDEMRKRRIEK